MEDTIEALKKELEIQENKRNELNTKISALHDEILLAKQKQAEKDSETALSEFNKYINTYICLGGLGYMRTYFFLKEIEIKTHFYGNNFCAILHGDALYCPPDKNAIQKISYVKNAEQYYYSWTELSKAIQPIRFAKIESVLKECTNDILKDFGKNITQSN